MDQLQIITAISRFLTVLNPLLEEWGHGFEEFRHSMMNSDAEQISVSLVRHQEYQQKFLNVLRVRDQILKHAVQLGFQVSTLKELVSKLDQETTSEMHALIENTESRLRGLHRQLWTMWVIANRNQHSLSHMLEMFTQDCGQRDVYSSNQTHVNNGGLLLDAAA